MLGIVLKHALGRQIVRSAVAGLCRVLQERRIGSRSLQQAAALFIRHCAIFLQARL